MKRIFLTLIVVGCLLNSYSQEMYRISQYTSNSTLFSPSLSAFNSGVNVSGLVRKQWASIQGAPTTGMLNLSSSINASKFYINGNIIMDQLSVYRKTEMNIGLSYKLKVNDNNYFSGGIAGGFNSDKVDLSRVEFQSGDNLIYSNLNSNVRPLLTTSVSYGNIPLNLTASIGFQDALKFQNVFGFLTKKWILANDFDLHTSALFKYSAGTGRSQTDLNVLGMYKETIGIGAGYRLNNELVFMARVQLFSKLQIGYAYDMSLGKLNGLNGHEVFLSYKITKSTAAFKSSGYTNPIL